MSSNCKKTAPPGKRTLYAIYGKHAAYLAQIKKNKKKIYILIRRHAAAAAAAALRLSPSINEADWQALNSPGIYLIDICAIIKYLP